VDQRAAATGDSGEREIPAQEQDIRHPDLPASEGRLAAAPIHANALIPGGAGHGICRRDRSPAAVTRANLLIFEPIRPFVVTPVNCR